MSFITPGIYKVIMPRVVSGALFARLGGKRFYKMKDWVRRISDIHPKTRFKTVFLAQQALNKLPGKVPNLYVIVRCSQGNKGLTDAAFRRVFG